MSLIARTGSFHDVIIYSLALVAPVLCTPELNGVSTAMKLAENTESTEQSVTLPKVETGRMNTTESFSTASTVVVHSEQPAPVIEVEPDGLITFFAVGFVINIVMITAYFFWAYKQWGKTGASALRQAQDDRK